MARSEPNLREAARLHRELVNPMGLCHDIGGLAVVQLAAGDVAGARAG